MERMIAFCGLVCTDCAAYQATQADDDAARERVAALWRKEYGAPFKAADINCDGCVSNSTRLVGHCSECDIRACGLARSVANCAHCADYETCAKLARFFGSVPEAKAVLDAVRGTA